MTIDNHSNAGNADDVRAIVTARAPYIGNAMRIPQDIQQKARRLCWKYNTANRS